MDPGRRVGQNLALVLLTLALAGAILLARRNLKLGRGDKSGAFKIAFFFLVSHLVVWAIWVHHVPRPQEEWQIFTLDTGYTLFLSTVIWLLYVGLEPVVRRRWPDTVISWSRLLAGRFRDPLVGRDLLAGAVGAVGMLLVVQLVIPLARVLGFPPPTPEYQGVELLGGVRLAVGNILDGPVHAIFNAMLILFVLLLLRIVLRVQWLAVGVCALLLTTFLTLGSEIPALALSSNLLLCAGFLAVAIRFGLLALTVILLFFNYSLMILTTDLGSWYAPGTILVLLAFAGIVVYAFVVSLGGQPAFGRGLIDEG